MGPPPFQAFVQSLRPQTPLRAAITSAYRRAEPVCLPPPIEGATLPAEAIADADQLGAPVGGRDGGAQRRLRMQRLDKSLKRRRAHAVT